MMTLPTRLVLAGAAGAALVVAGVIVYATAPTVEFGWFAYAPLPDEIEIPSNPARTAHQVTGLLLAAIGLTGSAGTAGYAIGRRRAA